MQQIILNICIRVEKREFKGAKAHSYAPSDIWHLTSRRERKIGTKGEKEVHDHATYHLKRLRLLHLRASLQLEL